jgi:hypothetical protein
MDSPITEAACSLGSPYPRARDERWDALLFASGHTGADIERLAKENQNFYLFFEEATKSLSFDTLNEQFWKNAETENGGFQEAATRYARSVVMLQ